MCEDIYEETVGCLSIRVERILEGTVYAEPVNQITADVVCVCEPSTIIVEPPQTSYIECGLVCSVDIGLPVLYASDGALITIEGQYLLVEKARQ